MAGMLEASFDLAEGKISIDAWQERFGGTALLQLAGGLVAKYAPGGTPTFDRAASYITVRIPVLERVSQVLNKEITFSTRPASAQAGPVPLEKSLVPVIDQPPSTYRLTQLGENYIRFESSKLPSKILPEGVIARTYAAANVSGEIPSLGQVNDIYNLLLKDVLRDVYYKFSPKSGQWIEGPKPVMGGTGEEVYFPFETRGEIGGPFNTP